VVTIVTLMQVYDLNNDLTLVSNYNTRLFTEKVNTASTTRYEQDKKNNFSPLTQDQKHTLVSEKLDSQNVELPAGIQFQENTPVANLLESLKSFNDTQKILNEQFSSTGKKNSVDPQITAETIFEDTPVGYYVVVDETPKPKQQKLLKGRFDLIKERISKTYNLGFRKETGSLVNLTA
jgi:hypothetical protein